MSKPKFILYDKRETVLESWLKDAVTFGFVVLCIYVSRDSAWWTFFTGGMALLLLAGKAQQANSNVKKCNSKDEVREWLDSLD